MALVVFRSRAAGEIFMFAETARRIFDILGRAESNQGVITSEQIPDALQRLSKAIDAEKALVEQTRQAEDAAEHSGMPPPTDNRIISLAQRAYPLMEMLRAAQKRQVEVTWGI